MERAKVYQLIDGERAYQEAQRAWRDTDDTDHDAYDWLQIIDYYRIKGRHAFLHGEPQRAIENIRKIAALCVAAMEHIDCPARETEDMP